MLGGGQLGRMFAAAASRMGYRVAVFSPERDGPAAQVAHESVVAPYADLDAVLRFAHRCDVVTLEFENVPAATLQAAAELVPTRPGPDVLGVAQDRLAERRFLSRHGLPVAPHATVTSAADLVEAIAHLGTPVVVKSARFGYDGHGQARVSEVAEAPAAWARLGVPIALCESFVDFSCELSVLVARSPRGEIVTFGPIENHHVDHILSTSVVPSRVSNRVAQEAVGIARDVALALDLQGLICVEMFLTRGGRLLVNELAPRPHNSGHLTIEACSASQFEQQVRAVCNLPLAPMKLRAPAAMVNLLGDLWELETPTWSRAMDEPSVALHLYGKSEPRRRRKMGHLTALGTSADDAHRRVQAARNALLPIRRDLVSDGSLAAASSSDA